MSNVQIDPLPPLTAALLDCVTPPEVANAVVRCGITVLGAHSGLVAVLTGDGQAMEIIGTRDEAAPGTSTGERFSVDSPPPFAEAVRRGEAVSLPLTARQKVFGVLHFAFAEVPLLTEPDRLFLEELARQCSLALDRALLLEELHRVREEAEEVHRGQEFLAHASRLLAESLDYQTTLDTIARLAVPEICDWVAVDMVDTRRANAPLLHLAVAHTDPTEVAWVKKAQQCYPVDMTQTGQPSIRAISTGQTVFLPDIPEEVLLAAATSEEHLKLIRKLDLRSYLCVPLTARGKTLGAVTFASTRSSGRVFTTETVALVEELARRAATAVDKAHVIAELAKANKRQQNSLNQSEERFRLLVEGVRDYAIFLLDPEGLITTWNAGAQRFKGYTAEEIIGQHFSRFYTAEDITKRHPWQELEIAVREGRYEEEGWRVRKDGSQFWANVVITALRDENGELRGFAKVTRDVTERRLHEQERATAEGLVQQRRFLKDVLQSVTEGKLLLCDSAYDLPRTLSPKPEGEAIVLTKQGLRAVRTHVSVVSTVCRLPKDSAQDLITATSECAMNAIQHAGGGTVRVYGDAEAGRIQVWITDEGKGIDLSNLPRATLESGFSTGGVGIGHGFSLMIACCQRVYLLTGANGTTIVLEHSRTPHKPSWIQAFR